MTQSVVKICLVLSGRTELLSYSNYYVIFSFLCCLDFDTTYSEGKNAYRKSKQVKIDKLFPLQCYEVQIELNNL